MRLFPKPLLLIVAFTLLALSNSSGQTIQVSREQISPLPGQAQANQSGVRVTPRAASALGVSTHERFATFLADKEFHSELVIQNQRLDIPVTVTPILVLAQGEVPLNPVTIAAHDTATVGISDALRALHSTETRGAVVARYDTDSYGSVSSVVVSEDTVHNLFLTSVGWSREEFWYGTTLDAVLWSPDEGTQGFISVVNTSSELRLVDVTFSLNGRPKQAMKLQVPARQASFLSIDSLVARSRQSGAGIHLSFIGNPGDIAAEGAMLKKNGFVKYIRFSDTSLKFASGSLRTNFLLLGQQPPEDGFPSDVSFRSVAAIRNIDSTLVNVQPIIKYLSNGSVRTVTLKAVTVAPNQSQLIDFLQEQRAGNLPRDFRQGTLELSPDSGHTSIVGELFNFDEATKGYLVGSSFSSHPTRATESIWRLDGTFQTTIVVHNTAAQDDEVSLKIFSGGDTYEKLLPVPAGAVMKVNLKQLQQDAVPDKNGHLLTATSGTLALTGSHGIHSKLSFDKLVHSSEATEYIGLLPNPCNYVTGIGLFLVSTDDPATYEVDVEADWTDGSITDDPSSDLSSGNNSLASVSGSLVTLHPSDGSSHSVGLSDMEVETSCDICSGDDFFANTSVTVPPCATPNNFQQTSCSDQGSGDLRFTYSWGSSTGHLADLGVSHCTVGEIVTYPGTANPFPFPSPPFPNDAYSNPTIGDINASDGGFQDDHLLTPSTTFVKPYSASSFTATQFYRSKCACGANANNYVNIVGPLSIVRSVSQNSNGSFKFTVTKSSCSATINPLP